MKMIPRTYLSDMTNSIKIINNKSSRAKPKCKISRFNCRPECVSKSSIWQTVIFLLYICTLHVTVAQNDETVPSSPPPPHAAALASPGGIASSSILEQFSPNCSAVAHIFTLRGIDAAEIPTKPKSEMGLRYCESPSVGTCCTYGMETKMAMKSRLLLERQTKDQIGKMSSVLAIKAQKFNEVFRSLLLESKREFHTMFTRTYGVIYQQNSYVFSDLFNELENYYNHGRVDLIKVMDTFFNTLYQKMFQVLNSPYSFDEKYLKCVSEHMKELKPFGDVPDKLSVQIKRSFVATRTYAQALATAADVSKKLINIRFNADCTAALTKMQNCGACKGYIEKPCKNYCINVIKGCLHYFTDLDLEWENFATAMDRVADRLLGSFNIVMVVEPINIKISEAIMNFQDSGPDITERVFQGCGRPSLGRTRRSLNPKFNNNIEIGQITHLSAANDVKQLHKPSSVPADDQIENDFVDIDAHIDDAVVLREKRSGDLGSQEVGTSNGPRQNRRNNNNNNNNNSSNNNGPNQKRKGQANRKNNDNDYAGRDPILDKLVREIRQRVKDSKKFWSNLPNQICSNEDVSSLSDADGMCWNGHTIDRYMHSITTEHGSNPEFPGNPSTTRQTSQVATQLYYLKNVIGHLRNAHNGQDVDWTDQEEPYYGSGSGSGGGSDDEDDDEGSGLGTGSPFTPIHEKSDHIDHTSGRVNNVDDEDDEDITDMDIDKNDRNPTTGTGGAITTHTTRPKINNGLDSNELDKDIDLDEDNDDENDGDDEDDDSDGSKSNGSGSATKPEKMTLRRALLLYLLPLYMAWFGGVCVDLL